MSPDDAADSLPPPSPEAVLSIIEVMDFIEHGDREKAARYLRASYEAASPLLFAAMELRRMSQMARDGETYAEFTPSPMEFDWIHYALWADALGIADLVDDDDLTDAISRLRVEPPTVETSPALAVRYARLVSSRNNSEGHPGPGG